MDAAHADGRVMRGHLGPVRSWTSRIGRMAVTDFDHQEKLVGDDDIRLAAVTDWCAFMMMGIVTCLAKSMPAFPNSWPRHCSYPDSNRPGPMRRCTSIASPITRSVNAFAGIITFSP